MLPGAGATLLFSALLLLAADPAAALLPPPPTLPPLPVGPVGPLVDDTEDTINGVTDDLDQTLDDTIDGLDGATGGVLPDLPPVPGSTPPPAPGTDPPSTGGPIVEDGEQGTGTGSGTSRPDASPAARRSLRAATAVAGTEIDALVAEPVVATTSPSDRSRDSGLADALTDAGRRLELPIAFLGAVLLFLVYQDRSARRDPKLVRAPVSNRYVQFR